MSKPGLLKKLTSSFVASWKQRLSSDAFSVPEQSSGQLVPPPLASDQAKVFLEERKLFERKASDVSSKIQDGIPRALRSSFNQCFLFTCPQDSSVFIHTFSGHAFCSKCGQAQLLQSFLPQCLPAVSVDVASLDAVHYYSNLFPDQNITQLRKGDLNSWQVKKILQVYKASKIFLDTLEDFECFVNIDQLSLCFTFRDVNRRIVGHELVGAESAAPSLEELMSPQPKKVSRNVLLKQSTNPEDNCLIVTCGALNACAIYQSSSVTTLCIESCSHFDFPSEFVPLLADYTKIIFFLPDMTGNYQIVHRVSKLLGQDRCFYISAQAGCKHNSPLHALRSLSSAQDFTDMLNEFSIPVNSLSSSFVQLLNDARFFLADPESSLGYPFHRFDPLNNLLGGLRLGEMTVISGDTGQGKTTFATELALDVCLHNNLPTAFISLEMQPKIVLLKMGRQLVLQEVSWNNFDYFRDVITNVPMFISNCSGYVMLKDILLEFEKMCMQYGVRHIVIDHLQYLQGIEILDNKVRG